MKHILRCCPHCRFRHPAGRTCIEAKALADAAAGRRAAHAQLEAAEQPEPFVVRHYVGRKRPSIKGNGFYGLELGHDREEAERFVVWINARLRNAAETTTERPPPDGYASWYDAAVAERVQRVAAEKLRPVVDELWVQMDDNMGENAQTGDHTIALNKEQAEHLFRLFWDIGGKYREGLQDCGWEPVATVKTGD